MKTDKPDLDLALSSVQQAADALAVASVVLGGLPVAEPPDDALDIALQADEAHQKALATFAVVFDDLGEVLGRDELWFELEAKMNEVVATATDVGFRLGVSVRTARPRR